MLGEFSPLDGSVEFYGRINAFLQPHFVVVDLGAGRGGWFSDGEISSYQRSLRLLKGKVSKVIGLDVDDAVLSNQSTDQNIVMTAGRLPLEAQSVDVVIADFVLEHLGNPRAIEAEVHRVLKAGGLFCARTPHSLNYVSIGSRLARRSARKLLRRAQPGRKEADVFETSYRCNTLRRLGRIWDTKRWISHSYLYTAEPSYDFGSPVMYRLFRAAHKIMPAPLVGNIFVFEIKR
jgi:ubiquinone/menaquinone biosynthesis C-methylase UbiE